MRVCERPCVWLSGACVEKITYNIADRHYAALAELRTSERANGAISWLDNECALVFPKSAPCTGTCVLA